MATSSPLDFSRAWRWARPWPGLGTGHGPKWNPTKGCGINDE
jgi:hypothetical protein